MAEKLLQAQGVGRRDLDGDGKGEAQRRNAGIFTELHSWYRAAGSDLRICILF